MSWIRARVVWFMWSAPNDLRAAAFHYIVLHRGAIYLPVLVGLGTSFKKREKGEKKKGERGKRRKREKEKRRIREKEKKNKGGKKKRRIGEKEKRRKE